MPDTTAADLRRAALVLEDQQHAVQRAVAGLVDLAGPQTWVGGAPRRLTDELEQAVRQATTAAGELEAQAALARRRAEELDRSQVLSARPLP